MDKELTYHDFYYVYDKALSQFLTTHGIRYILKGKSVKDDKTYTMYQRTDKLNKALELWGN